MRMRMKKQMKKLALVMVCTFIVAQIPVPPLYAKDSDVVQNNEVTESSFMEITETQGDEAQELSEDVTDTTITEPIIAETTTIDTTNEVNSEAEELKGTERIEEANQNQSSIETEIVVEEQKTVVNNLTTLPDANGFIIENGILKGYSGSEKNITIPAGVTTIGESAFYRSKVIESVTIPVGVKIIEETAFYECTKLSNVNLPEGLTTIGKQAFRGCTVLTNVILPSTVTTIGGYAFKHCEGIINISIPNGVTTIGEYTFYGCINLTSISLPTTLTVIGDNAFYGCTRLIGITIPDNLGKIGDSAFYNCTSLTSVTIPRSVTIISDSAFDGCNAGKVYTSIGGINTNYDTYFTIYCYKDSYAYTYATTHKITIIEIGDTNDPVDPIDPGDPGDVIDTILVNQIRLNTTKVTLAKKASITLLATVLPEDAEDKTVIWYSSDEDIATVSDDGVVTAVSAGTTIITATANDESEITSACTITVSNGKSYKIKYTLNKGLNALTNPTYYATGTKIKLANPTRKNYIFTGWYIGEEKVTSINKTTTGNITLVAHWEKVKLDKTIVKSAKNNKEGQITVSFEKLSGASGYTVYYSTDKKLSNATKVDLSSKKKSATINGLVKGTTYYITVKAYKVDSQANRIYGKSDQIIKVKVKK